MKTFLRNGFWMAALPVLLFSGCTRRPMDHPMGNWDYMMRPWGYGGIFMWLILIVILVVVVYFLFERKKSEDGDVPERETPLEILKKRYAKGEITKEEFDRMKDEIK